MLFTPNRRSHRRRESQIDEFDSPAVTSLNALPVLTFIPVGRPRALRSDVVVVATYFYLALRGELLPVV